MYKIPVVGQSNTYSRKWKKGRCMRQIVKVKAGWSK